MENTKSMRVRLTRFITLNAVVAALYAALTIAVAPLSYGLVQFRFAECLTILPIFFPSSYIGLTIGCLISNVLSPVGIYDMIFGSLATLAAGYLTSKIRKMPWAMIPPILINAFAVPLIWLVFGAEPAYWLNVLTVGAGQAAVIVGLGVPLFYVIQKNLKYLKFAEQKPTEKQPPQ